LFPKGNSEEEITVAIRKTIRISVIFQWGQKQISGRGKKKGTGHGMVFDAFQLRRKDLGRAKKTGGRGGKIKERNGKEYGKVDRTCTGKEGDQ